MSDSKIQFSDLVFVSIFHLFSSIFFADHFLLEFFGKVLKGLVVVLEDGFSVVRGFVESVVEIEYLIS